MNDNEIIALYWSRDERAISETDIKYGRFCKTIAVNILTVREDAEECVNDTYHKAWTVIPPQRPEQFRAWLGPEYLSQSVEQKSCTETKSRHGNTYE